MHDRLNNPDQWKDRREYNMDDKPFNPMVNTKEARKEILRRCKK